MPISSLEALHCGPDVIAVVAATSIDGLPTAICFKMLRRFFMLQNIGGGFVVGRIRSIDRDTGINGDVSYYIIEGKKKFCKY